MSVRSKKRGRWAKRLIKAQEAQQRILGFRKDEIRRTALHHYGDTHLAERIIKDQINNLIVREPHRLIFAAMRRAKKGKPDPILGDSYLPKSPPEDDQWERHLREYP